MFDLQDWNKMNLKSIKHSMYYTYLLLTVIILFSGCHRKQPPLKEKPPTPVKVITIEPKTIPAVFQYIGVINSSHQVEIRARVTGYIDEIGYVEGSFVKKDDLLFQLDPRPYQATLAQMKALVASQEAVLWQATRAVARYKPLYEQKAASQRDLDNALASEMNAEAQVLSAKAQVEAAEINLGYTTIRSPVSGLAAQAKYRVGALISPEQDLMTTVSVVDPIWVEFSVSEQDVLKSQEERTKGRLVFPPNNEFQVELILADQSVFPEKGLVNFSSPTYSQTTGTLMIRAVLKNPNNILLPGQFVRVNVIGATRPDAIVVPQQAVVQSKGGTLVFVVNADNKAEVRPIEAGPWDGTNWVINSGLNPGDIVIVDGVNKVLPGASVKPEPLTPKKEKTPKDEKAQT